MPFNSNAPSSGNVPTGATALVYKGTFSLAKAKSQSLPGGSYIVSAATSNPSSGVAISDGSSTTTAVPGGNGVFQISSTSATQSLVNAAPVWRATTGTAPTWPFALSFYRVRSPRILGSRHYVFTESAGGSQTCQYSSDGGATWNVVNGPTDISHIAKGTSYWVGQGNSGGVYYSSDGTNFSAATYLSYSSYCQRYGCVSNGSLYGVVVWNGTNTYIARNSNPSATGSWAYSLIGAVGSGGNIEYGGSSNLFVFVTANGGVYTSPDLSTWTSRTSVIGALSELFYINSTFIATSSNGTLMYSADGITWTQVAIPVGTGDIKSVEFVNGHYVVTASYVSSSTSYVFVNVYSSSWNLISSSTAHSTAPDFVSVTTTGAVLGFTKSSKVISTPNSAYVELYSSNVTAL